MSELSSNQEPTQALNPFAALGLRPELNSALDELGYTEPTPVQAQTIPPLLDGRDVVGRAQTGSGKTAAFSLPFLHQLDRDADGIQALVLTPTRELALQVAEATAGYARKMPWVRVTAIYGGAPYQPQLRALAAGVHVLVATPGRLIDHLKRGTVNLESVRAFVLDEADQMLNMGFIEDVEVILERVPDESSRALFSATMPAPILRIASKTLRDPFEVKIAASEDNVPQIEQRMVKVNEDRKLAVLSGLLETQEVESAIVFARTQARVAEVSEALLMMGHSAEPLHGGMNQPMRERVVSKLRDGSVSVVVATDVAARGIDVERISHVFNLDMPYDAESYVHRIGRTGRAGRSGISYLFVTYPERRKLAFIERKLRQKIEVVEAPSGAEVAKARSERFLDALKAELTTGELDYHRGLIDEWSEALEIGPDLVAAAILRLTTRERPLEPQPDAPRRRGAFGDGFDSRHGGAASPFGRSRRRHVEREHHGAGRFRGEDQDRPRRSKAAHRRGSGPEPGMVTLRLGAGRRDQLRPQVVVAAIAGAASIPGSAIGRIEIGEFSSFVDVQQSVVDDVLALPRISLSGKNVTAEVAGGSRPVRRKNKKR